MFNDEMLYSILTKLFQNGVVQVDLTSEEKERILQMLSAFMQMGENRSDYIDALAYLRFINEVKEQTKIVANSLKGAEAFRLVGVEANKLALKQKYGLKLYERMDKEVLLKENGERDFTTGNLVLAFLQNNEGEMTPLIDVNYLCELFFMQGIRTNISDDNVFSYERINEEAVSRS